MNRHDAEFKHIIKNQIFRNMELLGKKEKIYEKHSTFGEEFPLSTVDKIFVQRCKLNI